MACSDYNISYTRCLCSTSTKADNRVISHVAIENIYHFQTPVLFDIYPLKIWSCILKIKGKLTQYCGDMLPNTVRLATGRP